MSIEFSYTERVAAPSPCGLYQAKYRLPGTFAARLSDQRVAMVDDAMSAGSSLKATYDALIDANAMPVVAGAFMTLGTRGIDLLATMGVPVETLARHAYDSWSPHDCPLCQVGVAIEVDA